MHVLTLDCSMKHGRSSQRFQQSRRRSTQLWYVECIPGKESAYLPPQIDCLSRGAAFDGAQQLIHEYESKHAPSLSMHSEYERALVRYTQISDDIPCLPSGTVVRRSKREEQSTSTNGVQSNEEVVPSIRSLNGARICPSRQRLRGIGRSRQSIGHSTRVAAK